jgi:hypothetical protein
VEYLKTSVAHHITLPVTSEGHYRKKDTAKDPGLFAGLHPEAWFFQRLNM